MVFQFETWLFKSSNSCKKGFFLILNYLGGIDYDALQTHLRTIVIFIQQSQF